MTIQTKEVLKGYFTAGAFPTSAQFSDLIDTLTQENITALSGVVADGVPGVIYLESTSSATVYPMGSWGKVAVNASSTSHGLKLFGFGDAGIILLQTDTTASARSAMGMGTFGGLLANTITTASAKSLYGLGTAADLDVGTSANQVVVTDANGRLPSLDARNLTHMGPGELIVAGSANNTTSGINIPLGLDVADYSRVTILVTNVESSTDNTTLNMHIETSAGDYASENKWDYQNMGWSGNVYTADTSSSSSQVALTFANTLNGAATSTHGGYLDLCFNIPETGYITASGNISYVYSTGTVAGMRIQAVNTTAVTSITSIRLFYKSSAQAPASATFTAWGIRRDIS